MNNNNIHLTLKQRHKQVMQQYIIKNLLLGHHHLSYPQLNLRNYRLQTRLKVLLATACPLCQYLTSMTTAVTAFWLPLLLLLIRRTPLWIQPLLV